MHETIRNDAPQLSVVLATDTYQTIKPVIAALRRQASASAIELVIVLPCAAASSIDAGDMSLFAGVQVVRRNSVTKLAAARADGIRAATAPVVFIGETHTYPQAGWAQAILAAFDGGWAAVVPAIDNANPTSAVSWAAYIFDYGCWSSQRRAGEMRDPLIYNTGYRRSVLVSLGADLERALDPGEEEMWTRLSADGHRAFFASEARILHLNVSHVRAFLIEKLSAGAVVGMRRAARWSMSRRLLYLLASPLIPVVLLARLAPAAWRLRSRRWPLATIPALLVAAIAKAAGELLAYAGAKLPALEAQLLEMEISKAKYAGIAREIR